MIFCNAVPIAAACLLGKDVVQSTLDSFWKALVLLVQAGKTNLTFN
jgi:hypothetical protein